MPMTTFLKPSGKLAGPPLVSVIMNCLNCEKYLREAIESVYSQTFSSWEIILWDNASNDKSGDIARSFDGRLRYFRGETTIPLGAARNKAIEQARGSSIAFLDCDDIWLPTKLERQIPLFDDPDVDLVFSDVLYFNVTGRSRSLYGRHTYYVGNCFGQLLANYCISMVTAVIRRSALDHQPNWFDERFQVSEESELFLRLAYKGKLAMVDEPLAKYRIHSESWTMIRPELFEQERELMLQRFQALFPGFNRVYASQIRRLRVRHAFSKAKHLWIAGDSIAARNILRPYLIENMRASLLYLLSFSPSLLGRILDNLWNIHPK